MTFRNDTETIDAGSVTAGDFTEVYQILGTFIAGLVANGHGRVQIDPSGVRLIMRDNAGVDTVTITLDTATGEGIFTGMLRTGVDVPRVEVSPGPGHPGVRLYPDPGDPSDFAEVASYAAGLLIIQSPSDGFAPARIGLTGGAHPHVDVDGPLIVSEGIASSLMHPVQVDQGTNVSTTSAAYVTGAPACEVDFTVPASGAVLVTVGGGIAGDGTAGAFLSFDLRDSATNAVVYGVNDQDGVLNKNAGYVYGSYATLVEGLTYGQQLTARTKHRASIAGHTINVYQRRLLVAGAM